MQKIQKKNLIVSGVYDQQSQSCLICLQPAVSPVKCTGCSSFFCSKCAQKWKNNKKRCPKKCTQNEWTYQIAKPLSVLLKCPYNNQDCKNMSLEQFQVHYKLCSNSKFLAESKTEQELKKQYLCKLGHKLTYIGSERRQLIFRKCARCEVINKVCRSLCQLCEQYGQDHFTYCILCRVPFPNVTRTRCPQQHKLLKRTYGLSGGICDYCQKNIQQQGNHCYYDNQCDYVLCLQCYNKLPQQEQINEIQEIIQ